MSVRKSRTESRRIAALAVTSALLVLALEGCGKESEDQQLRDSGGTPVTGVAAFGSQCPFGSIAAPQPTRLELWNCPLGLDRLELAQPLDPYFVQGDCKRKVITVRTGDRKLDTAWEVMPDGSFFFTLDGGVAQLKSDGPDHGACSTPMTADMMGKMDCTNMDKAVIHLETVWWMGKNSNPERPIVGPTCQVPSSCYLYAAPTINQCS